MPRETPAPDGSEKTVADETEPIIDESPMPNGSQRFVFALTGRKFATIIVPAHLKARDIQIIKKQIELLELQIEEDR